MFEDADLDVLCCPACRGELRREGTGLACTACAKAFPIIDGIPRLLHFSDEGARYNDSWDYKWTTLDGGKGFNFEIIQPGTAAWNIHNVMRYFEEDGEAFARLDQSRVALDVGCGTGQYSVRLCQLGARRVYAFDLTRGVDVGRRVIAERYPELAGRIVFVQANARYLPVKDGAADLSMALASIHHSGHLRDCVGELARTAKSGGRVACWIYAKPLLPLGDALRSSPLRYLALIARTLHIIYADMLHAVLSRLPNDMLVTILRGLASGTVLKLRQVPIVGALVRFLTPGVVPHPDFEYRLINLYDAYSPSFSESSDEADVIGWAKAFRFRVVSFVPWRLGFVGEALAQGAQASTAQKTLSAK